MTLCHPVAAHVRSKYVTVDNEYILVRLDVVTTRCPQSRSRHPAASGVVVLVVLWSCVVSARCSRAGERAFAV